jgi:hypothetical protein
VQAAVAAGLARDGGPGQLTDELVGLVAQMVRLVRPGGHGQAWEQLEALGRHRRGQATVIPITIQHGDWQSAGLRALQPLPKDGEPVSSRPDSETAYAEIVQGVRRAIDAWKSRMTDPYG